MSGFMMTQAETLFAGPMSDYPTVNAASTSAQNLAVGATGDFQQPFIQAGFWPLSAGQGKLLIGHLSGKVTASTTATTITLTLNLATAPNAATGAVSLLTIPAITAPVTTANQGWELDYKIVCRGAGYGTTTVATSLQTSAVFSAYTLQTSAAPTVVTTIDATVNQWIWPTVTFSTSSTTNAMTLQQAILLGMN